MTVRGTPTRYDDAVESFKARQGDFTRMSSSSERSMQWYSAAETHPFYCAWNVLPSWTRGDIALNFIGRDQVYIVYEKSPFAEARRAAGYVSRLREGMLDLQWMPRAWEFLLARHFSWAETGTANGTVHLSLSRYGYVAPMCEVSDADWTRHLIWRARRILNHLRDPALSEYKRKQLVKGALATMCLFDVGERLRAVETLLQVMPVPAGWSPGCEVLANMRAAYPDIIDKECPFSGLREWRLEGPAGWRQVQLP